MSHTLPAFEKIVRAILAVMLIVLPLACGKSGSTAGSSGTSTAPSLPPSSTLAMDFTAFPQSAAPAFSSTPSRATTNNVSNFTFAYLNVAVWNAIITVGLAVPVYTFAEAFNHSPVLQSDGSWLWSYSKTISNVAYTAKLYGKVAASQVSWSMYISKAGEYTDFNWFNGTADISGTSGTWTMYESPTNPVEMLSIVWTRNASTGTGSITYTNTVPGGSENGGYISYGNNGATDPAYDSYYTIYGKSTDNLVTIEWSSISKNGRVKNQTAFGDALWHYWDTLLQDAAAPA